MNFDLHWTLFALFITEQIIMVQFGSYPYVWGIPITRIQLPKDFTVEDIGGFVFGRIKMYQNAKGKIFMRYKHYPLSWGPYVLVGQVKGEKTTELILRFGPLTALSCIIYFISIAFKDPFGALGLTAIVVFITWFYVESFKVGCDKIIAKHNYKAKYDRINTI